MKVFLIVILSLVINFFFAQTMLAADTGTVSATVTPQNISVSVADGVVAYGTLNLSSTADTTTTGGSPDVQTATNDGNVIEDFNIKSTNATGGTAWTLAGSIGSDQYMHQFSLNDGGAWTPMTTGYATLSAGIAASGNDTFDLQIQTPSGTTDYVQKTIIVTVQAVAG